MGWDQIQPPRRERASGGFRFVTQTACVGLFQTAACGTRYNRHDGSVLISDPYSYCIPSDPGCSKPHHAGPDTSATTGACRLVILTRTAYRVIWAVANRTLLDFRRTFHPAALLAHIFISSSTNKVKVYSISNIKEGSQSDMR